MERLSPCPMNDEPRCAENPPCLLAAWSYARVLELLSDAPGKHGLSVSACCLQWTRPPEVAYGKQQRCGEQGGGRRSSWHAPWCARNIKHARPRGLRTFNSSSPGKTSPCW